MSKIAIVVQRYGKEVLGGAETYAQILANALSENNDVTIITTTAKNHEDWKAFYDQGETNVDGINVKRFHADFERTSYFHELHKILLDKINPNNFSDFNANVKKEFLKRANNLPISFQDELIRSQGPYSSSLLDYIRKSQDKFDKFIFITYLYPTTYFGAEKIRDKSKVFIQTALHDEPFAYLSIWKKYRDYKLLFYTEEEKNIATALWGVDQGQIVGYGMVDNSSNVKRSNGNENEEYMIYAGRIDIGKGIDELIEFFGRYKNQHPESKLKLKIIGRNTMGLKSDSKNDIELVGFVSDEKKLELMSGAIAVIHPSPYESLSIVILEAFMLCTPVIVNGRCKVLEGHIKRSGGGFSYYNYNDFSEAINVMLKNKEDRLQLGYNGRKYFSEEYEYSQYQRKLSRALGIESDENRI